MLDVLGERMSAMLRKLFWPREKALPFPFRHPPMLNVVRPFVTYLKVDLLGHVEDLLDGENKSLKSHGVGNGEPQYWTNIFPS